MTVRRTHSFPLPLRERVASGGSREPGEGASSNNSSADTPSPALASLGHPLPQGEREESAAQSESLCQASRREVSRMSTPSIARVLRRSMTDAELKLWLALRARQIVEAKFRRQVPIGPYVADFACIAAQLVVELDGRPHDDPERRLHDQYRDAWLAEHGWRVLRIANDIVIGGGDIVVDRIKAALPRFPSSDPR